MPPLAVDRAATIPGWMDPPDLTILAEWAHESHVIVEVGSWQGRSTTIFADNMSLPGIVIAVDHWRGSSEHAEHFAKHPDDPDWCYRIFLENLRHHIYSGRVLPLRLASLDAAKLMREIRFPGAPVDLVFIDAAHEYEAVKADIDAWLPVVRIGGRIAGHDAGYEPVHRAIFEMLPGVETRGSCWSWRKT